MRKDGKILNLYVLIKFKYAIKTWTDKEVVKRKAE